MTKEDAYELLSYHSGRSEDIENPKWTNGFLGSLRTYQGNLYEQNFIEVMECIRAIAPDFGTDLVPKPAIGDIFSITYLGRRWINSDAQLYANGILDDGDQMKMDEWLDVIEDALFYLLNDAPDEAFEGYENYRVEKGLLAIN